MDGKAKSSNRTKGMGVLAIGVMMAALPFETLCSGKRVMTYFSSPIIGWASLVGAGIWLLVGVGVAACGIERLRSNQ